MAKFTIQKNDDQQTIFKFIKKSFSTTPLSVIYKWFRKGEIKINGVRIKDKTHMLHEGDNVEVYDFNKPVIRDQFKHVANPDLTIIYEDENILIINKEANLEVHSPINTSLDDLVKSYLVNSQQYHPEQENSFVVSHIHRLDKLTSGLIIYAKNKQTLNILLKGHDLIEKYYLVAVSGYKKKSDFVADGWLKYDPNQQLSLYSPKERPGYKKAITAFRYLKNTKSGSLLEARLFTGRKHQIRATLSYYDSPILNDFRYQGPKVNSERMIYLMASKIIFQTLPEPLGYLSGKSFEIPWPHDLD
ncbi:RluA family pseudouridine synthase [Entomoplasma freundtii]|uniref:RNA pseudouridylate synthase n=1 Tax=Entomoplasma freundtii TaxID=74700 RepID=A0A2K8NTX2_9MOLU|nr:RluA family pseudouridine synthase [Entomoplasma freundtii]ATZ16628.1 23S rRNA pseudouridine955/2504/2580 synthase [Entomoplasma freundtii]TDY58205.1 RluA family pseudouridine synthase [Entomoplasma freundtii]